MQVKISANYILKYFLFFSETEFDMSDFQGKISKMQMYPELSSADFAQVKQDKITVGTRRWGY